jgi:hypothetical protein
MPEVEKVHNIFLRLKAFRGNHWEHDLKINNHEVSMER